MNRPFARLLRELRPLFNLGVLLPGLMAIVIFFVFTDIVFSGGRRESLAGKFEKIAIEFSLRIAAYDAKSKGEVITISLVDDDLPRLEAAPSHLIRDAHLKEYAAILTKVLAMEPKLVVVSWLSSAHPTDLAYWQSMMAALRTASLRQDVMVALPINEISTIPPEVRSEFLVKEGEDCVYEVNSYCTYNRAWKDWMNQSLIERLWRDPPPLHVSQNLPHALPQFIANVPRRSSMPQYSFSSVMDGELTRAAVANRVVFIGNDTLQDPILRNNKTILRRTYTAESNAEPQDLMVFGTPMHVFWAQLSQMFIDRETVAVVPLEGELLALLIMTLVIASAMYFGGQATSVVVLLLTIVVMPVLDALSVKYFRVYLPVFLVGYGSLLVYVFAALGLVSFNTYHRNKLEGEKRAFALTADLHANFISLISHNLNTPVAKLLGLVDILLSTRRLPEWDKHLQDCRASITHMQFFARSTLLATSIKEKSAAVRTNVKALLSEFERSSRPLLKRLGMDLVLSPPSEEVQFTSIELDPRLGAHALVALAMLVAKGSRTTVHGELALREGDARGDDVLVFTLWAGRQPEQPSHEGNGDSEEFLEDILLEYVESFASAHRGSLQGVDLAEQVASCVLEVATSPRPRAG